MEQPQHEALQRRHLPTHARILGQQQPSAASAAAIGAAVGAATAAARLGSAASGALRDLALEIGRDPLQRLHAVGRRLAQRLQRRLCLLGAPHQALARRRHLHARVVHGLPLLVLEAALQLLERIAVGLGVLLQRRLHLLDHAAQRADPLLVSGRRLVARRRGSRARRRLVAEPLCELLELPLDRLGLGEVGGVDLAPLLLESAKQLLLLGAVRLVRQPQLLRHRRRLGARRLERRRTLARVAARHREPRRTVVEGTLQLQLRDALLRLNASRQTARLAKGVAPRAGMAWWRHRSRAPMARAG